MHDLSDAAVRKLTAAILARPEFSQADPRASYWVKWARDFLRWLGKIQLLRESSPALYWMIVSIVGLVGAGLVVHTIWTLWIAMSTSEAVNSEPINEGSAPDLAREAHALATSGNYLEAAHCLMIASFHALADHSLIELRPDRSNRWIRGAVRKSPLVPKLADEIDTLVVHTERRWFGGRENEPEIYARWLSAFERLAAELR